MCLACIYATRQRVRRRPTSQASRAADPKQKQHDGLDGAISTLQCCTELLLKRCYWQGKVPWALKINSPVMRV